MVYVCAANPLHNKLKENDKLPDGWKRKGDLVYCKACWMARFVMRAVTFPLAGPLDKKEWPELREALKQAWSSTTRLANWLIKEYAKADRVRMPEDTKLWAAPNPYLYNFTGEICPELSPSARVAIINTVKRKYNKMRLEMIWRGAVSLPSFKYPVPYPMPCGTEKGRRWQARYLSPTEKVPIISVPIGDRRFELRLRGGSEFKRQLLAFRQLVEGEATPAELAIYQVTGTASDHRPGIESKEPGGGQKTVNRIMVKLAMWLPIREKTDGDKLFTLKRGDDCFVMGIIKGRDPWIINADWIKTGIIGHEIRRQRISDDLKFEKRWPKQNRLQQQQFLELICKNHNNRLKTFIHTTTKMIAEFARRQKCSTVEYNATPTEYLSSFPWFDFKTMLEYKLGERGVTLVVTGEPLAKSEVTQLTDVE